MFIAVAGRAGDSTAVKKQMLYVGLRFEKVAGLYWNNGVSFEYSSPRLCRQKITFGFYAISSRLGSALASNAIPYTEINLSAIKYFRESKRFRPLLRLNLGYAHANYGSDVFYGIPQSAALASFEAGAAYQFKFPLRASISGGYNFITGNGASGLALVYPVYAQVSVFYLVRF